MLKELEVKKCWVWDYSKTKEQRYVIDVCNNGCVAVLESCEEYFINGECYDTMTWCHHEEIKETKMRTMTALEAMVFLQGKDYFVSMSGMGVISNCSRIDSDSYIDKWYYTEKINIEDLDSTEWKEFKIEDKT